MLNDHDPEFQPIDLSPPPPRRSRRTGAPKGNLNALRNGRSSRQIKLLADALYELQGLEHLEDVGQVRVQRLVVDAVRADLAAHKEAAERARRILDPFRPERLVDRIAHRILLDLAEELRS
jgi:hypothetical protein